ncbi:hypothetical protein B0H67DRAFT_644325 [Lasiosphaeris hirsuta]|uniref:Uncharacterized protein n=1 Tax=Lasiosphaeris hirsuta TaxID=260670 RepID=A0AA40E184_9PEZI|nr:hypothetical protein B0H67DRAFT_644325 [Lasiosphaeris hirsuta]
MADAPEMTSTSTFTAPTTFLPQLPGLFATARRYLLDNFSVTVVHALGHWLIFGSSDMYFNPFVGEAGERYIDAEEEGEMEMDEAIIACFKQYTIPITEAIIGLAGLFPECDAMTFVVDTIVVENRESATQYLAYTEVFDPLIEEKWRDPFWLPGWTAGGNSSAYGVS